MRKTILQAILAAISCVLAHGASFSMEGGRVMLIGLRNGMMADVRTNPYVSANANLSLQFDGLWNTGSVGHTDNFANRWVDLVNGTVAMASRGSVVWDGGGLYSGENGENTLTFRQPQSLINHFAARGPTTVEICLSSDYDKNTISGCRIFYLGSWCFAIGYYVGYSRWSTGFNINRNAGRTMAYGYLNPRGTIVLRADSSGNVTAFNEARTMLYDSGVMGSISGNQQLKEDSGFFKNVPNPSNSASFDCRVYAVRVYDGCLGDDECMRHILTDKARFNLP